MAAALPRAAAVRVLAEAAAPQAVRVPVAVAGRLGVQEAQGGRALQMVDQEAAPSELAAVEPVLRAQEPVLVVVAQPG